MAELYLGRPLFPGSSEVEQLNAIVKVMGTPQQKDWPEGYHILGRRNQRLPTIQSQFEEVLRRAGASESAIDMLRQMLTFDKNDRITAQQCLNHSFLKQTISTDPKPQKNLGAIGNFVLQNSSDYSPI